MVGFILILEGKCLYFVCDMVLFFDMFLFVNFLFDVVILLIGDLFMMGLDDFVVVV